jgi:hypothetical protein
MLIALGIILAIVLVVCLIFKFFKKEDENNEALRYDNFGHNWEVEETVNKALGKFKKPIGTLFEWEAKSGKPADGVNNQILLDIKLRDSFNENQSIKRNCSISHIFQGDNQDSYEQYYSQNQHGYHWNRSVCYIRRITVKEAVVSKINEKSELLIADYIKKYPSGNMDNYKNGVV